ncbi:MFS transporter [Microbacterium horticulturae]|uniref:MFS transporter n=1 Tax=Microbacterium horticulturae TaxID=3028316 RepID=A0ABY8BVM4_9MICO|nr:MFS transporter [Microbacterium sp. KACC 23027]WEG08211.1 MFS transporter [Microbacterium sp. KACC 23027]
MPSEPPTPVVPGAPLTETTFVATAAGNIDPPEPIKGLRRLMIWIIPANLGIFMVWGAVPGLLLPQQITNLVGQADRKDVAVLAIVTTIGALAAMIAQPVAGQISDRTRSRFGRRAPWILIGALAGALALVGLAFAGSVVAIIIAWTLVQIAFNFAQGPLSAVMPDRVALKRRGTFAALSGIGLMVGSLGGTILGALFFHSIAVGYIVFAVFAVVILSLFVAFNPDHPSTRIQPEPFRLGDFLRTFWVNPVAHPDFFWAFTGRLLLYTGYFIVVGYQLYLLRDYFHVAEPETIIPVLSLLGMVGLIITTLIGGPLSDRVGRRKPFVFASAIVMSLALLLPWFWQDLAAWYITVIIVGFGFGMFQAVDQALISEVLPSAKSFAKDLGVVNIAATLPQTIAPGVAGAIVLTFGFAGLFPVGIVLGILGACAVWPIKATQ